MIERRSFLKASLTMAATLSLPAPLRAALGLKRILGLGGTNYVGPHIVHSALRAGTR